MHNTLKGVSVQSIAILGMGVPSLAKVTQSRDNISSLIETIVNPPSNLRSTIRDIIQDGLGENEAYHFNRRVARSERLQTLRRGYLRIPQIGHREEKELN